MRIGYFLPSLAVTMLASLVAGAQTTSAGTAPDSSAVPPPPAAGYPPPPPGGYPPPPPGGYPPPPPGGYPPPPPGYEPQAPLERTANNSIYIEGLGPGILYSVNYERTFEDFAGRVGFSYIGLSASASDGSTTSNAHVSFITVPLTISYLGIGSKKNIFEIGAGTTIVHVGAGASIFAVSDSKSKSSSTTLFLGDLIFGYRLQPPEGGFMLRTGISPIFGGGAFVPLPYLSLGGTF